MYTCLENQVSSAAQLCRPTHMNERLSTFCIAAMGLPSIIMFMNHILSAARTCTVMVCPLTLHVLLKPRLHLWQLSPFPNLSDQPLTHLGHQPTSHSLSQTLVCSYYLSLPDTLNPPCLHFSLWPSTLTSAWHSWLSDSIPDNYYCYIVADTVK